MVAIALVFAAPSHALLITINEVTAGGSFPIASDSATAAPASLAGSGSLGSVVNAAADYWESVILDPGTLTVNIGWAVRSGGTLATATQYVEPRDFSGAGKMGDIRFDSDGTTTWFADGTPLVSSEYLTFTETSQDLGAGSMTIGREFSGATGDAAGAFDLFTVALHEIGHLLGLSDLSPTVSPSFTGTLEITSGPFDGATISLTPNGGGHLAESFTDALMQPFLSSGQRRLASDLDLAVMAELSGFNNVAYGVAAIPEPTPLLVFSLMTIVGVVRRRG